MIWTAAPMCSGRNRCVDVCPGLFRVKYNTDTEVATEGCSITANRITSPLNESRIRMEYIGKVKPM